MVTSQRLGVAVLWSGVLVWLATSVVGAGPHLSSEQIRQFLLSADVVASRPIGRGITQSWRLTLSDGRVTHDAAFQSVDDGAAVERLGPASSTSKTPTGTTLPPTSLPSSSGSVT